MTHSRYPPSEWESPEVLYPGDRAVGCLRLPTGGTRPCRPHYRTSGHSRTPAGPSVWGGTWGPTSEGPTVSRPCRVPAQDSSPASGLRLDTERSVQHVGLRLLRPPEVPRPLPRLEAPLATVLRPLRRTLGPTPTHDTSERYTDPLLSPPRDDTPEHGFVARRVR